MKEITKQAMKDGAEMRRHMEDKVMNTIILEILNLERKNLRTGRKSDKVMVDEIAKIIVDYSRRYSGQN